MDLFSLDTILYTGMFFRLLTIFISASNERKLKKMGAVEYGAFYTNVIIAMHFLFYGTSIAEGYYRGCFKTGSLVIAGPLSNAGLVIFMFSIMALYYVIYAIRHVWTVKLIIAPGHYHRINKGRVFRLVRHPNYYLNVIPELIAIALIFHAWYSLLFIFPFYLFCLLKRIKQEEEVMSRYFPNY